MGSEEENGLTLISVIQLELGEAWFRLPDPERETLRREIFDVLEAATGLTCRWFGADPWTGRGTEFLLCEFSSLTGYWKFWDELRNHRLFTTPVARIASVSLGYERSLRVGLVET